MFIEEIVVETVSQYLETVVRINEETDSLSGAVYRGQSNSDWSISSGLSRYCRGAASKQDALRSAEQAFRIFNAHRHGYHAMASNNPWDVLTLAQHFGMPTRLLDWSLSPFVALFFALDGVMYKKTLQSELTDEQRAEFDRALPMYGDYVGIPEADAAVYMIPSYDSRGSADWLSAQELPIDVFSSIPDADDLGFCFFNPDVTNDRIKHQSGLFTLGVHPDSEFPASTVYKIILKKSCTTAMRGELVTLNIGAKSVYGDIEGLCRELVFIKFGGFSNRYRS